MVIIIMILTINVTVLLLRKKYNNNQNPFHVIPIINLLHWKVSRKSKRTSKNFQISYEVGANCLLEFKAEFVQFGGELVPIKKQLTAFSNCGLQSLNCGVQVKKYMFIIESLIVKTDRTLIYSVVTCNNNAEPSSAASMSDNVELDGINDNTVSELAVLVIPLSQNRQYDINDSD